MKTTAKLMVTGTIAALLGACGSASTPQGPDLGSVLDRTVMALEYAEAQFEKPEGEAEGEVQLENFSLLMHQAMNLDPAFYNKPVGIGLREDASFVGFEDNNGNNISDAGEKDIFTVELDAERNRIIATDITSGEGTYRVSGAGLLAGYIAGRLIGRQGRAGVKPSSFASRNVKSSADYRKARPAPRARSSTRSGSSRAGK
jgi:hypothetical protein